MARSLEPDEVVAKYIKGGRLVVWPRARERRMILLDFLAQLFEPGRRYPEKGVNAALNVFHDDYAMLRRYLVDEGFMERDHGMYWRAGGSYPLD